MLTDEFKEIRYLADELYDSLDETVLEDEDIRAHLQGDLEEVVSLMDDAILLLSEL